MRAKAKFIWILPNAGVYVRAKRANIAKSREQTTTCLIVCRTQAYMCERSTKCAAQIYIHFKDTLKGFSGKYMFKHIFCGFFVIICSIASLGGILQAAQHKNKASQKRFAFERLLCVSLYYPFTTSVKSLQSSTLNARRSRTEFLNQSTCFKASMAL